MYVWMYLFNYLFIYLWATCVLLNLLTQCVSAIRWSRQHQVQRLSEFRCYPRVALAKKYVHAGRTNLDDERVGCCFPPQTEFWKCFPEPSLGSHGRACTQGQEPPLCGHVVRGQRAGLWDAPCWTILQVSSGKAAGDSLTPHWPFCLPPVHHIQSRDLNVIFFFF